MSGEADQTAGPRLVGSPLLSPAVLAEVYAHAREGYPEEVCGFILIGAPNEAGLAGKQTVRRCDNRQNALHAEDPTHFPRNARTAYNLGARDLFFLDRSLKTAAPVCIIYHSHIDVGAYFSDEDARAAAPDGELLYPVDYLVIDVAKSGVRGCALFRFETPTFIEVERHGP